MTEQSSMTLPERINLQTIGLRRSNRLRDLQERTAKKMKKAHVTFGSAVRRTITLWALVCTVTQVRLPDMPSHRVSPDASFYERCINRLDEANELIDGSLNEMNCFAFATKSGSNETYTFRQVQKQPDIEDFITAMEKEIADHEQRGHWTMVKRSSIPSSAKTIKAIWSFKRKRFPDGRLNKHKARLCAHGGMQTWGENYWETYSPVVNMMTVKLLLVIARVHGLHSKSIDFVLAFPQADLDTDIWMELPAGTEPEGVPGGERDYVVKLNKSLYGLKQASFNWFEKLKKALIDRNFTPSVTDPCLYLRKGMAVLTYVDDCIIVGTSKSEINDFVKSLANGSENFKLTDEGSIDKFLGIEITDRPDGSFEMSQPFLISRIVEELGIGLVGEEMQSRDRTPASSIILDKDLDGKPRKHERDWKYRTVVGMMQYLQANTRPDTSMATHQTARFSIDPKLSHEKAVIRIGKYLRGTAERGIIFTPDKTMGLECYVDADFAGGWNQLNPTEADTLFSRTGFVIKYANCPIYWKSKLQTELALSTAEAEYIALSMALREVIPLMTMMEELKDSFPQLFLDKPGFFCKVWEDNQACLAMATSHRFSPRTKHIALKYHHFRSFVERKRIRINYVDTLRQQADIFTKPVRDDLFPKLRFMLMGW